MDTIFVNLGNGKIFNPQKLVLNLADIANLKRSDKCAALPNLSIYYTWENILSQTKIVNLSF